MSLRVLIVDDERLARVKLQRYLSHEPDVGAIRECANGVDAIDEIRRDPPDILLLDVQMPEVGGFDVLHTIGTGSVPALIFVTAHDQYAVKAFDVEASDYLLKPFDRGRFRTAFERARRRLAAAAAAAYPEVLSRPAQPGERTDRILVHVGRRLLPICVDDIYWLESADNYARVHTAHGEYLVRESLAHFEERLNPELFTRVHRRVIVNVCAVAGMHRRVNGGCELELHGGRTIPVARTRRRQFLRLFRK